jgi:hypothetical protein
VNPQAMMQLEFHQLERRWEHLRVRQPQRQRRLMASLAESGQQTPIVVVLSSGEREPHRGGGERADSGRRAPPDAPRRCLCLTAGTPAAWMMLTVPSIQAANMRLRRG